ncbi:YHS domain-containing (seleno)protein [Larkinella rosea]|uniref:YHS domain protein n=1 Tax=Larkinella rosea TaxID=2025312 RepID=A0A3P1BSC2_9BACT|nr:YHS domain-containing (seleno)protein [Larkinella rosea]RRB03988.1 YHS domain protein [Larkinella rosea]
MRTNHFQSIPITTWLFTVSLRTVLVVLIHPAIAQNDMTPARQFNLDKGLAIQGYDPVSYFTSHKAIKGLAGITATHNGATYRFSTAANRDRFLKTPSTYEPSYGGWCAFAMGDTGEKVEIDPETFEVRDGRLYLFYHTFFNNTLPKWQKDEPNLQRKADQNWKKFTGN